MECNWACLPQLTLIEIFSYLSHNDRIQASSVCKTWRSALFYPHFWSTLTVNLQPDFCVEKGLFLIRQVPLNAVSHLTVAFSADLHLLEEVAVGFSRLKRNNRLKCIRLLPTQGLTSNKACKSVISRLADCLRDVLVRQSVLEELDFGYFHGLVAELSRENLNLCVSNAKCLRSLNLATVKYCDEESINFPALEPILFQATKYITSLSINYQHLNDDILAALSKPGRTSVKQVHLVVQHVKPTHRISDLAWTRFSFLNPDCQLHISVIKSKEAVDLLHTSILQPSMPLASLTTYFCKKVNVSALHLLSRWYDRTLQTLRIIDAVCPDVDEGRGLESVPKLLPHRSSATDDVDPLVMIAWKCKKLKDIAIVGYQYSAYGLLGIARLRGAKLSELTIPASCIYFDCGVNLMKGVRQALGRKWRPLRKKDLDKSITDPAYRWDSYVLEQITRF